jgi:UDP-2,4-diacetamido-2,4,6-trideoxy-beta-L-altropyranose hydrolase
MRIALTPACRSGGGGGHVARCLALARALASEGAACLFVVEALGADVLERLGWTGDVHQANDAAARSAAIRGLGVDAAVVDDYRLDAAFEAALGVPVLAIDDLADRPHASALLLDSAYGREAADYAARAPDACLLLGPAYALLRRGFAGPRRAPPEQVGRVFASFGLSDVEGITARAVGRLRPLAPNAIFDVALGRNAPSLGPLQAMAAADPRLVLHLDADVAPLMRTADLGVGAGGGMVWERRAAGLPQLVVTVAENQRPMAARLAADGVIARVDLADPAFDARLAEAFTRLLAPGARLAQIDNPNARCDGQGAARAARALVQEVSGLRGA